jgi:hypothetical protein
LLLRIPQCSADAAFAGLVMAAMQYTLRLLNTAPTLAELWLRQEKSLFPRWLCVLDSCSGDFAMGVMPVSSTDSSNVHFRME